LIKFLLDGEYIEGVKFYKLAIDKLRRFCETLPDGTEKQHGNEVS
jgi:hypothetical protein